MGLKWNHLRRGTSSDHQLPRVGTQTRQGLQRLRSKLERFCRNCSLAKESVRRGAFSKSSIALFQAARQQQQSGRNGLTHTKKDTQARAPDTRTARARHPRTRPTTDQSRTAQQRHRRTRTHNTPTAPARARHADSTRTPPARKTDTQPTAEEVRVQTDRRGGAGGP